jgi:hypothetical protein
MRSVKFRRVAKELFDDNGLRAHGCNPRKQNADHVFAAQIACMGKIAWVGTHGWDGLCVQKSLVTLTVWKRRLLHRAQGLSCLWKLDDSIPSPSLSSRWQKSAHFSSVISPYRSCLWHVRHKRQPPLHASYLNISSPTSGVGSQGCRQLDPAQLRPPPACTCCVCHRKE